MYKFKTLNQRHVCLVYDQGSGKWLTETLDLKYGQELEMDSLENKFATSEVIHQAVNAEIKFATELILRQVEKLCALIAERNELDTSRNGEATGSGRGVASASSADKRYDTGMLLVYYLQVHVSSHGLPAEATGKRSM